ncbi:DUF4856 domain-containing protein [Polaribacter sargassicola]|uniref:DUF4856 domain-containing protein n=1 Tax=Polaribacter sargassicola TaxID=2836891 RepID=UPI001F1B1C9A|nr:DUF4856 domain-containing protein [Polaribacter sp. DS7-9]MCG1037037.1 DUF4856 domain-containing protein [Polaribacter sp. DS7-9]
MRKIILSLAIATVLISCNNNNEDDTQLTVAPSTYTFERNGITTVSFSGQTTRIEMGEEFVSALSDNTQTTASLSGKFAHSEGESNFSDADLNASDKSIRSKTAASTDFYSANTSDASLIKSQFDSWIAAQVSEVYPNWNVDAVSGTAGKIQEAGGGSTRYVNAKGLEYNQVINKGLIGGLMVDQILNNYLSPAVLDAGDNVANNDADVLDGDNNYTTMEHKWDEAFGYLYGLEADVTLPVLGADSFLNKYLDRVEGDADFTGIAADIYDAFKLGRAAIVNKDYTTRDEQAAIIKEKISEIIGIRAVYYLQQGKANLGSDYASAFHDLSEGLGFVYSLQFTRKPNSTEPYLTKSEVDGFMSTLQAGNGFWDVTSTTLDDISNTIASKFNFTVTQAGS